jgi:hypothetical protein
LKQFFAIVDKPFVVWILHTDTSKIKIVY